MSTAARPPRLAVVLPVRNRRVLTLRALKSLCRSAYRGLELRVIVVDDASSDGTPGAVRAAFPEVELQRGDGSLYYAGGTNTGLRAALAWDADYVVAANDDSIFGIGALEAMLACARHRPRTVVGAVLLSWSEPHRVFQVGPVWDAWFGGWRVPVRLDAWSLPGEPFEVQSLAGNCLLLPAEALREVGLMDEVAFPQHGADLELCARLRRAGWRLLVEPRARVWCQPNSPPSLSTVGWGARFAALFRERTHPLNLRGLFLARWRAAPSRLAGLCGFLIFVVRLALHGLGLGGPWPAWPDPPAPLLDGREPPRRRGWPSTRPARLLLAMGRGYTRWSPIRKGSYRLARALAPIAAAHVHEVDVVSTDGRRFVIDFRARMYETLYFLGEYERALTAIVERMVGAGQVCLDVGANFGWYATLFGRLCGRAGAVYAFEPQPAVFATLQRNLALAGRPPHIRLEPCALGDESGTRSLHLFPDQPTGHASLSPQGRAVFETVSCPVTTWDEYARRHGVAPVDFVKIDVEGAEMAVLRGAASLFRQPLPPVLLIEMALNTGRHFDQTPNDLLDYVRGHGDYDCFQVDERNLTLARLDRFPEGHPGANVICVPRARGLDALRPLLAT